MPSTATPRSEPSTLARLLRGAKRGGRQVVDAATAQYFEPREFAQGMADATVAAPDAILDFLRSPREKIRSGLDSVKDSFATPERTGATLVSALPSLVNALRGRGSKKDIIITGEDIPKAQRLKLPVSDYWVDQNGVPNAWMSDRSARMKSQIVPLQNGNNLAIMGDTGALPPNFSKGKGHTEFYTERNPLFNREVENLLQGRRDPYRLTAREFQDYIDHPDLFKLDPDMRHVPVRLVEDNTRGGAYHPSSDFIDLNLGSFRETPKYPRQVLEDLKGLRAPGPLGTYQTNIDPFNVLMHEGQHRRDYQSKHSEHYRGGGPEQFSQDGLEYLQYMRLPGEIRARFTGGGQGHYTEQQRMSPNFVAKALDLQTDSLAETLRRVKEVDLKQEKQK